MPADIAVRSKPILWLLLILLVGAGLRFYRIGDKSLWVDEFASLQGSTGQIEPHSNRVKYSPFGVIPAMGRDTEVPVYYMALNLWIRVFRNSEAAMRSLSALFGVGAIGVLFLIGRRLLNERVGLIGALILALAPLHVCYAQEARSYALKVLLILLSAYFFIRMVFSEEKSWPVWVGYLISAGLAIYTHYFAVFVYLAFNLFLILGRRDLFFTRRWLGAQALLAVAGLWLFWSLFHIESYAWIQVRSAYDGYWLYTALPYVLAKFTFADYNEEVWHVVSHLGFGLGVLLFAALFFQGLIRISQEYGRGKIMFLLMWLVIPILILIVIDLVSKTKATLVVRYLIAASPAYYLILAAGVDAVKNRYLKIAGVSLMAAFFLVALFQYYQKPKIQQWKEAAQYIDRQPSPVDLLLCYPGTFDFLTYYTQRPIPKQGIEPGGIADLQDMRADLNGVLILIEYTSPWARPDDLSQISDLMASRYQLAEERQWQGVKVLKYARKGAGVP